MSDSAGKKPVVVGLYGISGCGKTYLLGQLKQAHSEEHYLFYEGSEVLASVVEGALDSFKQLPKDDQTLHRERAIDKIKKECAANKARRSRYRPLHVLADSCDRR